MEEIVPESAKNTTSKNDTNADEEVTDEKKSQEEPVKSEEPQEKQYKTYIKPHILDVKINE